MIFDVRVHQHITNRPPHGADILYEHQFFFLLQATFSFTRGRSKIRDNTPTTTFRCPARYLQTVVMPDVRGWYVRSRYDLRYWQESDSVGLPRRHVEHSD